MRRCVAALGGFPTMKPQGKGGPTKEDAPAEEAPKAE